MVNALFFELETSLGNIEIELFKDSAPKTCENFIAYLKAGYYENTSFFRIVNKSHAQQGAEVKIEVVQGGPKFSSQGHDPKRMLQPLIHESTDITGLKHLSGSIAMGRFAANESYGGFFFCIGDQPELNAGGKRFSDGKGTAVFAQLTKGKAILQQIFSCAEHNEMLEKEIVIFRITALNE
ncbi:MAG: peptidyl-prolyl cis-trans isomerase A (cyclophilin A) [Oceanospirillaceae bacterium]